MKRVFAILAAASVLTASLCAEEYDLVIYGGTSAGVIAAVQAKKMGKSVVDRRPGQASRRAVGGGLGFTDTGNKAVIGGLSREFYHRVWKHYEARHVEVAEEEPNTATRARARRPSTARTGRCGSSSRTWPSRSSRIT